MGSVYLAEHPTIGKKVALKVLHAQFSNNEEVAQRFFHEAKAVNNIGHPNIVDIVDYGMIEAFGSSGGTGEQLFYFIMEYLAGQSLSALIRAEAPLAPERALGIALQVADALAASHKCGIVHRDLKPDNIMLQQRGRERDFVKLLDFGIAKVSEGNQPSRTRTGLVMGTPAYMSPEQCEGKANVDLRTDIYALGIVLYEMLSGRVPFIGEGYGEILVQHLTQPPIPPSQYRMLPPHVEIVVLKALEKRMEMRYPNMDEFMRALSDPVGYVEGNGGTQQFLQRQLMPSTVPFDPGSRLTPAPLTPPPGSLRLSGMHSPLPTHAAPTTLGAATGQQHGHAAPKKSKVGFVVAGLLVVVGAAIAIAVVLSGGGKKDEPRAAVTPDAGTAVALAPDAAAMAPDAAVAITPDAAPVVADAAVAGEPAADAGVVDPGPGSGSGSSAAPDKTAKTWTLTVTSKPAGATIYVDDKVAGKTPAEISVTTDTASIAIRAQGFGTFKKKVKRGDASLDATLAKATGGGNTSTKTPTNEGSGKIDTGLERPF